MAARYFRKLRLDAGEAKEESKTQQMEASSQKKTKLLQISTKKCDRFATRHLFFRAECAGDVAMIQRNMVRNLLCDHAVLRPSAADNEWRVLSRSMPPPEMWRAALPSLAGDPVPAIIAQTATAFPGGQSSDLVSSMFWLSARGFDAGFRSVLRTLASSPDGVSVCPYLGVHYCAVETDGGMAQALDRLVATGALALYDRLLLRQDAAAAAATKLPAPEGPAAAHADVAHYGIVLSHASFQVYCLRPCADAQQELCGPHRPLHQHEHKPHHQATMSARPGGSSQQPQTNKTKTVRGDDGSTSRPMAMLPCWPPIRPAPQPFSRPAATTAAPATGTAGITAAPATDTAGTGADPWTGCRVTRIGQGSCLSADELQALVNWVNEIHRWGQGPHAAGVEADVRVCIEEVYGGLESE